MEQRESNFFAYLARMKYIARWGLMRNTASENIAEHSLQVAMLAHGLVTVHNVRFGGNLSAERAAVLALYHDAPETITGDLPTPVKYANPSIKEAYRAVEEKSCERLLSMLPEELRDSYCPLFFPQPEDEALRPFVKAADKLSAYFKCLEEACCGNAEFKVAEQTTRAACVKMEMPEVDYFLACFAGGFTKTLDEMNEKEG